MTRRPLSFQPSLAAVVGLAALLAPTLSGADTCNGLDLGVLAPAAVGTTPVAVAVGDFNRDGKLDAAAANNGSNNVTILFGSGTGGFTPVATISTGATTNPVDIVAGDLDHDGILDLVVAFGAASQALVLHGQPTSPWFVASTPFGVGFVPSLLALADFNRDSALDLVIASESGKRLRLTLGTGSLTFGAFSTDIDLSTPLPGEQPSGVVPLDFNRDGRLDLAVVMSNANVARIYYGNGFGNLAPGGPFAATGTGPVDVVAGDINRDGWPDLVTANSGSGDASVLLNSGTLTPTLGLSTPAPVGGTPKRVALHDLNHDGILDLVALDASATPRMVGVLGLKTGPPFFQATPLYPTPLPGAPGGLAVGRFTADGRADLVTALAGPPGEVVVVENRSGTPCTGTSFALAPRGYAAGDAPVSTAAADFDGDGRPDLAVASENDKKLRLLRNVAGHFADFLPATSIDVSPATPAAVATADLDADGDADLVAAVGNPDTVRVFRGNGLGGLTPGDVDSIGALPSALVIGDFDGNGIPDVAATSEGSGSVFVYLGDGLGGLAPGIQTAVGAGPRALVAGFFNADAILDLAVANSASSTVSILLGNGNGTFTPATGSPFAVGTNPWGIAAGNIDGDLDTDLVTANNSSGTVSVLRNDGSGTFSLVATLAVPNPTAVALLELTGDSTPDLAVTSGANRTLTVFTNSGGTFVSPSDYPVRTSPRAITPIDVDADGRLDLAVPCWNADSVAVLLSRPPTLLEATRVVVGDRPHAVVAADLDGDGDLDLAVANPAVALVADDSVSLLRNDGGAFTVYATLGVGQDPESIVAGDFNRDGRVDLVLNASGATPALSIFFGSTVTAGQLVAQPSLQLPGAEPDDLVAGDFDRDGDLDLAVCDKQSAGAVRILKNDGSGVFSLVGTVTGVGDEPTAIVAGDFDRDGDLDLAVANDISSNVRILVNDGLGGFTLGSLLPLAGGDSNPLSITAADFDGDGALDLAVAAFIGSRVHVYRNLGGGTFAAPVAFAAPATLQFVTAADLNRDGKPDLAAVAAGLVALRGKGGLDFELPETWVAGLVPWAGVVGDFNGDGRPDAAIVNQDSDDVSLLLSTTCAPRRLEVSLQPLTCELGGPPFFRNVVVETRDDGGNPAACSTGAVVPAIAPGTNESGAVLGPPAVLGGLPLTSGIASFTAGNALSIDRAGRRYQLQFSLVDVPPVNLPPALSRPFTLGPGPTQIVGPSSFCAGGSALYGTLDPPDRWDDYRWTLDGPPVAFTPSVLLKNPPVLLGPHTLGLTTRVDGCTATAPTRDLYVGELQSVTLQTLGPSSVCVDCIGGTAKAVETGGGTALRQWGYRKVSGTPPIISLPGETAETYTLKGASFPGPGNYYVVVTTTPACGPTLVSGEWPVTVVDSVPTGEVRHLAASSRGTTAGGGLNRLQWLNTTGAADEIRIRWNKAPDGTSACLPPAGPLVLPVTGEASIPSPVPMVGNFPHPGLVLDTAYCYSVFVRVGANWSPGRTVKARPFNAEIGPVKWAYATGGTAVAPPTVSGPAILAMSNDRTVHALTRGSSGGEWPTPSWVPTELQGVAHSRSPVVPFTIPLVGADWVLFAADDSPSGHVHAVDARTGNRPWPSQPQGLPITGAPGGMFTQYSGIRDLIVVGTRHETNPNALRGLNLADGSFVEAYLGADSPGPIGAISGTPAIDYPSRRVYFASRKLGSGDTLFCLEIQSPGPPVFKWKWSRDLGNILGSPVLRGGRVYVGAESGVVYSLDALTGGDDRTFTPTPADGPVKGFLFPDRRNDDLIFATNTKVWSIRDDGAVVGSMTKNWEWTTGGLNPSLILYWPETNFVYVGGANGTLYQLDFTLASPFTPPTSKPQVLGDGTGQIGAPSLDIGVAPKLLIVGSESGVLYGVEVPLP